MAWSITIMRPSPFVRHFRQQTRNAYRELELAGAARTAEDALFHVCRGLARMPAVTSLNQPDATAPAPTLVSIATNGHDEAVVSPAAVLECAPRLFLALEQMHKMIAAVFGYIHRRSLFIQAGCPSMKEYAAKHLGVGTESAFDKLSRAGKAAWDAFPAECSSLVSLVCEGEPAVSDRYPSLPTTSTLATLGTVLKWTPDREAVIARVKSGEWTDKHLQREQATHSKQLRARSEAATPVAPPVTGTVETGLEAPAAARAALKSIDGETTAATFFRRSIVYVEEATRLLDNIYVGGVPPDGLRLLQDRLSKLCTAVRGHVNPTWGGKPPYGSTGLEGPRRG